VRFGRCLIVCLRAAPACAFLTLRRAVARCFFVAMGGRVPGVARGRQSANPERGAIMAQETGEVTGTKDKDYNLIWFTEASLSNVLRLETYIEDAERE